MRVAISRKNQNPYFENGFRNLPKLECNWSSEVVEKEDKEEDKKSQKLKNVDRMRQIAIRFW